MQNSTRRRPRINDRYKKGVKTIADLLLIEIKFIIRSRELHRPRREEAEVAGRRGGLRGISIVREATPGD